MSDPLANKRVPAARSLVALIVGMGVIALCAACAVWSGLGATPAGPSATEIAALDARLTEIQDSLTPIATSFAAETTGSVIDVPAYRTRLDVVQDLIDSTNGLPASTDQAAEIRDLIVTGGAQVVSGLSAALDALESDDTSVTVSLDLVEQGMEALKEAKRQIVTLTGEAD